MSQKESAPCHGAYQRRQRAPAPTGDLDGAIAEYRTALRLRPDYATAHHNLGDALRAKGDLDGAIAEYRTAVHLQPDFAETQHQPW